MMILMIIKGGTRNDDDTMSPLLTNNQCALLIKESLQAGLENTRELLIKHDISLGRTIQRNINEAERLEEDIRKMKGALELLNHLV